MKRWILIALAVVLLATSLVFGGVQRLDLRMGLGGGSGSGHYLLIDNAGHYLLIDGLNHKIKISE